MNQVHQDTAKVPRSKNVFQEFFTRSFCAQFIILIPLVLSLNVDYNLMSLTILLKVSVEWHGLEQFFYESY